MPRIAEGTKSRARKLRHDMTEAEKRLWKHLRAHRLQGWPFRRQHPILPYVVDFAAVDAKLVVEVDGGQHAGSEADARRDAFLASKGWRVLRFWNNEVLADTEGVLARIVDALTGPPR